MDAVQRLAGALRKLQMPDTELQRIERLLQIMAVNSVPGEMPDDEFKHAEICPL